MLAIIGCALVLLVLIVSGCVCAVRSRPARSTRAGLLTAAGLLLLLGVAGWLRFSVVSAHHVMYTDEPWYLGVAAKISQAERPELCQQTWDGRVCEDFHKAPGWPTMLAGSFLVAGRSMAAAFGTTRLLGVLTVLLVAFAARLLGCRWRHVLLAAALAVAFPAHLAWSATAETSVPAAACLLAGLCGCLMFIKTGATWAGLLAISGLSMAAAIRPELLAAALAAGVIIFVARRPGWKAILVAGAGLMVAVLSGVPMWTLNREIYGGLFLSPAYLPGNLGVWLNSPGFWAADLFILGAGLAGAVACLIRSRRRAAIAAVLAAALASLLVVLFFERFQERMLIAPLAALLPFGACAPDLIPAGRRGWSRRLPAVAGACLLGCALWLFWPGVERARRPAETQLLETRLAESLSEAQLPADSLVLAEHPSVLALASGFETMASRAALAGGPRRLAEEVGRRPVFLLRDMYCEPGFEGNQGVAACRRVLEEFELRPVLRVELHRRSYGLFRLANRQDAPGGIS